MAIETTSTLSNVVKTYYDRMLLERLVGKFWHCKFGDPGRRVAISQAGQQRKSIEWRRWNTLSVATTALTEGTVPSGSNLSVTLVTGTPSQYGDFVKHSDVISMTSIDPFVVETIGVLADQAAQTLDEVARDALAAGTVVQYAGGVASRILVGASNKLSTTEIDTAVRTLEETKVPLIEDEFGGSYVAFVHPRAKFDLRADSRWQAADNYNMGVKAYNGELGRWNNVRLINNAYAKKFALAGASGIDVYATIVFGAHFYGIPSWGQTSGGQIVPTECGLDVEVFVKPLGSSGSSDPLNQQGSIGWKADALFKILNDSCAVRIEHATS